MPPITQPQLRPAHPVSPTLPSHHLNRDVNWRHAELSVVLQEGVMCQCEIKCALFDSMNAE